MFLVTQYFFLNSPLFQVRDVVVNPSAGVSEEEIRSRLSLTESSNFWRLSPSSLESDLLGHHLLSGADVDVSFPGRVVVNVSERTPSFYVAYRGKSKAWFSVDDNGVVLESVKPLKKQLKFLLARPLKKGSLLSAAELDIVRYFQESLSPSLSKRLRDVKIRKNLDLSVKLSFQNRYIWARLGRPERMTYKLFLLEKLLAQLATQKEQIKSIDLRYSAPLVKIKQPAQSH